MSETYPAKCWQEENPPRICKAEGRHSPQQGANTVLTEALEQIPKLVMAEAALVQTAPAQDFLVEN